MAQVNDDVPQICDNKLALPLFQITSFGKLSGFTDFEIDILHHESSEQTSLEIDL